MRSYRFARNTLVLLVSAFALASPGRALADEQNRLPEVINNVHVPIGTISIQGYNFGVLSPDGVAVNPRTNRIYTVEASGGGAFTPATGTTISVIDGNVTDHTWNKIIKNIQITNDPTLGSNFPAVNTKTNKIYVDLSTSGWYSPGVTQSYVLVIDGNTNKVIKTIMVNPTVTGIAVNESTNKIYISNYFADTVQVIDGNTDKIIKTIATHTPQNLSNPYDQLGQPAVSEKLNKIYVPNYLDGSVTVIDGANDTLITSEDDLPTCTLTVASEYTGCAPIAAAVNDRTGKVYVTDEAINSIEVLDEKTYQTIDIIPLSPTSTVHPYGIDIDRETNLIYVADPSGFIDVVDGETSKLIGTVPVGLPPLNTGCCGLFNAYQLAADSQHHRLYVATAASGALAILKTFGHGHDHWKESNAAGDK